MSLRFYEIGTIIFNILTGITLMFCFLIIFSVLGCINFKARNSSGDEFLYQRVMMMGSAEKVEVKQYDPNGVLWLSVILHDPNSRVNPGGIKIKEPKTGIEISGYAE